LPSNAGFPAHELGVLSRYRLNCIATNRGSLEKNTLEIDVGDLRPCAVEFQTANELVVSSWTVTQDCDAADW